MSLKAPFPYFGGKSRVASLIWDKIDPVQSYVEPFGGSLALYLHPRLPPERSLLNDLDGLLINFWRSVQKDPEGVALNAHAPISTLELQARHNYVVRNAGDLVRSMASDPKYYDIEMAAYWLYARSTMIGGRLIFENEIGPRIPSLIPNGMHSKGRKDLVAVLHEISEHLKSALITCSSWESTLNKTSLYYKTPTFVFLDPPYPSTECDNGVYKHSEGVWKDVVGWCKEHQDDPNLRIVLCGYEGTATLDGWECVRWHTQGGLASAYASEIGLSNAKRECVWFSPQCKANEIDPPLWYLMKTKAE